MSKISIIATRPSTILFPIISWGIRLLEWSKHSHVAIYFPDKEIVRHAHFNDIKEEKIEDFLKANKIVNMKTIELTVTEYEKIDSYTTSKIGKQKGYFSTLFGAAIPLIVRNITGKYLRNPFYKGTTCSEFVRNSLRQTNPVLVFILTNIVPNGTFTTEDAIALAKEFSELKD